MDTKQIGGKVKIALAERFHALRAGRSWDEFIDLLLNRSENPETTGISEETHNEAIRLKDEEINRLKAAHKLEIDGKIDEISALETQISEAQKTPPPPEPAKPGENQMLIEVNPFILYAIDDERKAAEKADNCEYTPSQILTDSFLIMKKKGRVYANRNWSGREFDRLKKELLKPQE